MEQEIDFRSEYRKAAVKVELCYLLIAALTIGFIGLAFLANSQAQEIRNLRWDRDYWETTANALYDKLPQGE